jgi:hypothetical protein
VGHPTKRDLLVALAMGCFIELGIWYPVFRADSEPAAAGSYPLLENLQQPGVRVAYFVGGKIWNLLKPHWSAYSSNLRHTILYVLAYLVSAIAFLFLIAMWSVVAFAVLQILSTQAGRITFLILGILLVIAAAFEFLIGVEIPLNPVAAAVFGIVLVAGAAAAKRRTLKG